MNNLDLLVIGVGVFVVISLCALLIWIDWHDQD